MKTEKWSMREGAGYSHPSVQEAEAVKVTVTNLTDVADWCGGSTKSGRKVLVPSRKFVGDPNKRLKMPDGKTEYRELEEKHFIVEAVPGDYVVKWDGRFYVPITQWFLAAYEKEK